MTHTYAELEISRAAWDEIAQKLRDAGYDHAFVDGNTIDMHGIGLTPLPAPPNMVTTPEGQLLFRYPPRDQIIDHGIDMKGAVLTLRDIADMRGCPRAGTYTLDPPAVAFTTYENGRKTGVIAAGLLGETPAREIGTPHIFERAGR